MRFCCLVLARSSCSHLLGGVPRLTVMGLSDSVLSCLLFIAGLLYLLDPLSVYTYAHTNTYAFVYLRAEGSLQRLCVAARGLESVSNLYDSVVEMQTRRYLMQETLKRVCDDKSHRESKLTETEWTDWQTELIRFQNRYQKVHRHWPMWRYQN